MPEPDTDCPPLPTTLLSLLREVGELKRVRSAGRAGSIATRRFLAAWSALAAGADPFEAMRRDVAETLVATTLGDLDAASLGAAGLDAATVGGVRRRAFDAAAAALPSSLRDLVSGSLGDDDDATAEAAPPGFALALAAQPRAGLTCPGRPRLVLEPPENHAEHCHAVAVYGVLLAPVFGADPATVWLAGLAHHLHNAVLPDSGFTGERLLGASLDAAFEGATARALDSLDAPVAQRVRAARACLPDAGTAEGRAFHAADTLDRVWQIEQHLRPGQVTLAMALGDMALVHDGPVKRFQDGVLARAGLPA